jgi:transcription-repair coupling factor (superfamily II helicase)
MRLIQLVQSRPKDYKLDQAAGALRFNMDMSDPAKRIAQVEMIDRFGLLPAQTKALFAVTELKLKVQPYGIRKIEAGPKGGRIVFGEQPNIDHMKLIQLVQSRPKDFKLDQAAGALRFSMEMNDPAKRIDQVSTVVARLTG